MILRSTWLICPPLALRVGRGLGLNSTVLLYLISLFAISSVVRMPSFRSYGLRSSRRLDLENAFQRVDDFRDPVETLLRVRDNLLQVASGDIDGVILPGLLD
jgi:hypothetical protein